MRIASNLQQKIRFSHCRLYDVFIDASHITFYSRFAVKNLTQMRLDPRRYREIPHILYCRYIMRATRCPTLAINLASRFLHNSPLMVCTRDTPPRLYTRRADSVTPQFNAFTYRSPCIPRTQTHRTATYIQRRWRCVYSLCGIHTRKIGTYTLAHSQTIARRIPSYWFARATRIRFSTDQPAVRQASPQPSRPAALSVSPRSCSINTTHTPFVHILYAGRGQYYTRQTNNTASNAQHSNSKYSKAPISHSDF